jgi:hypothetical protein
VPLSDTRVIDLLNRSFIPVYLANQDYRDDGCAPPEEKAELRRIHKEGHAAKLSVGSVHAYVLAPDGRLVDSMHVANAFKVDRLLPMLEGTVRKLKTASGEPVLKPAPQSISKPEPGCLLLHITARYLQRKGDDYVLVESAGGDWSAFPGEDWVSLEQSQWLKLLPSRQVRVGDTWDLDRNVAAEILNHFYPPTENNDLAKNRIDEQSLKATVVAVEKGITRARIDGKLKMKHPFYHKDDDRFVEATLAGFMEFDPNKKQIRSFQFVTDEATYGGAGSTQPIGVAVRLVDSR